MVLGKGLCWVRIATGKGEDNEVCGKAGGRSLCAGADSYIR